jgi:hypothetical protein
MIGQIYFDWKGERGTVKEFEKKLKEACKKTGAKYHGIYGPHQDKWNFCAFIEVEEIGDVTKTFQETGGMSDKMPHAIFKYYTKIPE